MYTVYSKQFPQDRVQLLSICGEVTEMGCSHGTEIDRNKATTNVSVDTAVIEAEKAVAFVLKGERSR